MLDLASPLDGFGSPFGARRDFNPAQLFGQIGASPAFVYATTRLVAAYNGPALRVLRPSDSAEQDIGFVKNRLDEVALYAFLGAQTGKVLKLYDQSGNGNDTATQATDANRLSIGTNIRHNGNLVLPGTAGLYDLPSLTFDRRASTFYTVAQALNGAGILHGYWRIGSSGDPYQIVTNGSQNFVSPAFYPPLNPAVSEFWLGASNSINALNSESRTSAALSAGTETGGIIGTSDSGFRFYGYGSAWVGYASALSTNDRSAVKAALNYAYGTSFVTPTTRLVFVGDSITNGTNGTFSYGYARRVQKLLNPSIAAYNAAAGGSQIQNFVSGYGTSLAKSILTSYSENRVVFLLMGTNDLTVGARTAAQIYADIQSYAALVKADGARIIVSTIGPNSAWNGTQQTTRTDLNASIRSGWAGFADGLCDFAADSVMGPQAAASNSALYADGLHPSDLGHQNMAYIAAPIIAPFV